MADKFTLTVGQAHDLEMAFRRNGWTAADVKRLSEGDLLTKVLWRVKRAGVNIPAEMTIGDRTYEVLSFHNRAASQTSR